jgi:hypothetical protein
MANLKTKPKRVLIAPSQRMEMRSLAQISGIPEQYVTEAYTKSFITGGRPYDLLQITAAWLEAEKEGRDYPPIFWHRTEDGVLHLTMWDMNQTEPYIPERWLNRPTKP